MSAKNSCVILKIGEKGGWSRTKIRSRVCFERFMFKLFRQLNNSELLGGFKELWDFSRCSRSLGRTRNPQHPSRFFIDAADNSSQSHRFAESSAAANRPAERARRHLSRQAGSCPEVDVRLRRVSPQLDLPPHLKPLKSWLQVRTVTGAPHE